MSRILLANQWGGGVGYVRNLRALADGLVERGHEVVLALPDLVAARPALSGVNYRVLQGPVWRGSLIPRKQTRTFADILANQAYADKDILYTLADGWRGMIDLIKPDQVIAEYAPVLNMAAHDRIPLACIGSPFCLPPGDCETFPVLNPKAPAAYPEEQILSHINEWLTGQGLSTLANLPAILQPQHNYPIGLDEMDPYRGFRTAPILPPLPQSLPAPLPGAGPEGPPRIFCYMLAQFKPGIRLMAMLAKNGVIIETYLKEANPMLRKKLGDVGVIVHEQHVPIREMLAKSHLLLHNGSTILSYEALAMGRAQLCFPMDLEKELNTNNLIRLGVAKSVRPVDVKPEVVPLIKAACHDETLHSRASEVASDLAARAFADPIGQIIDKLQL